MYYLRARYYDPQIKRFTSLDIEEGEILNPLDMNRYVYCRNNPVKYVDPSGESAIVFGVAIGVSALVATYATYITTKNISENRKHHILHGSGNKHESQWKKFGIDPNVPEGREKLLPIICVVLICIKKKNQGYIQTLMKI